MEELAVGIGVNVLSRFVEEIERRADRRNEQRFVLPQPMLRVHYAGCFNRIHVRLHAGPQISLNQARTRQFNKREPNPPTSNAGDGIEMKKAGSKVAWICGFPQLSWTEQLPSTQDYYWAGNRPLLFSGREPVR
jgi:hypothetical protein